MLRLFCVALLTLSLSGCAWFEPKVVEKPVPVVVHVPEELRECPGLPAKPTGDYTQRDVADYLAQLSRVAQTCKVRLDAVDDILDRQEARVSGS